MTFALDLKAFADKTNAKVNAVVRKITLDVAGALVLKSPVGDAKYWQSPAPPGYVGGRFRANWQLAEGVPNIETNTNLNNGHLSTYDEAAKSQNFYDDVPINNAAGKVYFITNSLPYSIRLEEGWSYRQAPNGMVALTVQEFRPIVEAAARAIQNE